MKETAKEIAIIKGLLLFFCLLGMGVVVTLHSEWSAPSMLAFACICIGTFKYWYDYWGEPIFHNTNDGKIDNVDILFFMTVFCLFIASIVY